MRRKRNKKPREFWIHDIGADCFSVYTKEPDYFEHDTVRKIHVIEKSAYDELECHYNAVLACGQSRKESADKLAEALDKVIQVSDRDTVIYQEAKQALKKYRGSDEKKK